MSFKIQKYSLLKRKKKRNLLVTNVWYSQKENSKQRKKLFFQKKVFLNEIGRKITYSRIQKTVIPFFETKIPVSLNISDHVQRKNASFQTLENQKKRKTNRLWFFQTAAPIPGVSFLKKSRKFSRENLLAFRVFRTFFSRFQKKQRIQRVLNISKNHKKRNRPKSWAFLMQRNSQKSRTFRQAIFVKNAQASSMVEKFCNLNGKKRKKKNFTRIQSEKAFQKPGDFAALSTVGNFFPFFRSKMYFSK